MVMITEKKIALSTSTAAGQNAVQLVGQAGVAIGDVVPRVVRQMAVDVLHHDHRRVDDDAEIDGADRQQIGGFPAQHRDDHGQEQRDRNRRRDDQRAAQVAEEHPLDEEDQRDAEQHVVQHRSHRDGDEVAAVVERLDPARPAAGCRRC